MRLLPSKITRCPTRIRWGNGWPDSKTVVSTMSGDDFFSNEKSVTLTAEQAGAARIELVAQDGSVTVLKESVSYTAGTVVDATFMSGARA